MKTFLEVGTCDFRTLNHLSDSGWRGVIVEPVKKYLNNIEQKPNIQYLNYAVDVENGTRIINMAPEELVEQDRDFSGMSSFVNRNYRLSEKLLVNTITFDRLIEFCDITELDILKIDTEGYDLILLQSFPFDKIKPKFIQAECEHIDTDSMVELLESNGYYVQPTFRDVFAYYVG